MSTIKTVQGNFQNASARYGIAVARFNSFIVDKLLDGALEALQKHGVLDRDIQGIVFRHEPLIQCLHDELASLSPLSQGNRVAHRGWTCSAAGELI